MSLYKYEESIVDKMREITGDDRIVITPSDNITYVTARMNKDEFKLPLVSLSRESWRLDTKRQHGLKHNGHLNDNFPMLDTGIASDICDCDGKVHRIHLLPMQFSHKVTVFTTTRKENDEYIRELLWFFTTLSRLYVKMPYGTNMTHEFTLETDGVINDESNVTAHVEKGQLFIQSFTIYCNDAYLWKSSTNNPTCIHIDAEVKQYNRGYVNAPNYNRLRAEEQNLN